MTNVEAEQFIADWWSSSGKVFRYVREFMFDEYILVFKRIYEPMFAVDITSTYPLKDMTKEEFVFKIRNGELVYSSDQRSGIDCNFMKTGGCQCGSWWDHSMKHSFWCPMAYKNR